MFKIFIAETILKQVIDSKGKRKARYANNRWNVEMLLMGYRRPHEDEDKYHAPNGEANSRYIPWIMKMTEKN